MNGPGQSFLRKQAQGFRCALRGVLRLLATERSAWIHALATLAVFAVGLLAGVSRVEWCLLVLAIALVWTTEGLNTAVEILGDAVSPQQHPLIGRAKDMAAGAVLMAALGAVVVGLLVLGPPLLGAMGLASEPEAMKPRDRVHSGAEGGFFAKEANRLQEAHSLRLRDLCPTLSDPSIS